MDPASSVACICETHEEAQRAMYNLQAAGIDMGTLSIATRNIASNVHKVDYYDFGGETFSIPGVGPLLVSGPLASRIVAAFESGTNGGRVSILGAALATLGIAPDSVLQYEAALRSDKYLLLVHGSPEAIASARAAIGGTVTCFHTIHAKKELDPAHALNAPVKGAYTYQT